MCAPRGICKLLILNGLWWTWRGSNSVSSLITRKLLISQNHRNDKNGRNANWRYTAGTRTLRWATGRQHREHERVYKGARGSESSELVPREASTESCSQQCGFFELMVYLLFQKVAQLSHHEH